MQDRDALQRDVHRDSMTGARLEWLARYDIVRNRATSATAPSKQRRHCHDDGGFTLAVKHARSAVFIYDHCLVWTNETPY
jgi:hypothetical protein